MEEELMRTYLQTRAGTASPSRIVDRVYLLTVDKPEGGASTMVLPEYLK
jgi:hypothetical protein